MRKDQFWRWVAEQATRAGNGDAAAYEELVGVFETALPVWEMKHFRGSAAGSAGNDDVFSRARSKRHQLRDPDHFLPWVWGLIASNCEQVPTMQMPCDNQKRAAIATGFKQFPTYHAAYTDFAEIVRRYNFEADESIAVQCIGLSLQYLANDLPELFEFSSVPVHLDVVMLDPEWDGLARLNANWPELARANRNRLLTFLAQANQHVTGRLFGYSEMPHINGFSINNRWFFITWADGRDGDMRPIGPEGYFLVEAGEHQHGDALVAEFRTWFDRFCDRPMFPPPASVNEKPLLVSNTFEAATPPTQPAAAQRDGPRRRRPGRPPTDHKDSAALVIAALNKHHGYENGSVANYTPATNRGLAAKYKVGQNALCRFLKKKLGESGYRVYVSKCTVEAIGPLLMLWNGELPCRQLRLRDDDGSSDDAEPEFAEA